MHALVIPVINNAYTNTRVISSSDIKNFDKETYSRNLKYLMTIDGADEKGVVIMLDGW